MALAPENPHALSVSDVSSQIGTDLEYGLSDNEASARLNQYGPNELPPEKQQSLIILFLKQFHSGLAYILMAAAGVSILAGHGADAIGIFAAMLIKAVIGFVQERRAEGALEQLRVMVVQEASVIRDRRLRRVPARELVPGDVVVLAEGDRVTADMRLIISKGMTVNESALTGESMQVRKSTEAVDAGALLPDRFDMVWMGTSVVGGEGRGIVVETGPRTAFGRIAASLVGIRRGRTPLELRLDKLGRQLGFAAVVLCAVVMGVGTMRGFPLFEMFLFAIALMVSIVPEGLPAVLAVVLAIGVQRMAKRKAIMRHVPSVETLGITDVICTDKTGTLTENKMTVREIAVGRHRVRVSGEGWDPRGEFTRADAGGERRFHMNEMPELDLLLRAALLCNKASLQWHDNRPAIVGDPTEGALTVMAAKAGYDRMELQADYRLVDEMPFNSDRKYRAMLYEHSGLSGRKERVIFVVGAYGIVRDQSMHVADDSHHRPFDDASRASHDTANHEMAGKALRVLGVAFKRVDASHTSLSEGDIRELVYIGTVGMIDPPRVGVRAAIERCGRAGVRVVMITGDQKATAMAIGREIGLVDGKTAESTVHTEKDVAAMSEEQFAKVLRDAVIFARVTPETKLRIVSGLQAQGHIVAMTGDGVNDAPALKKASIGIAMGITGTDVTKEVADMVLADDNFVSIVNAIEEGRIVFRNVKQTTAYLFMTNVGEIVTIFASILVGLPLPILPAQILWMNLVTDGFPDVALATEPPSGDTLSEPPRSRNASVITKNILVLSAITCTIMALGTIGLFAWELAQDGDLARARTVAFSAMAVFQLWNVFNMRSLNQSLFKIGWLTNRYVLLAVAVAFSLQMLVVYAPFMQPFFSTTAIGWREWLEIIVVTGSVVIAVEAYKSISRKGVIPKHWM